MPRFVKDPNALKDYSWDWTEYLEIGEIITSAEIIGPPGTLEVVGAPTHDDTTVTVWLDGGIHMQRYFIPCRITTSKGRQDDRSLYLLVKEL